MHSFFFQARNCRQKIYSVRCELFEAEACLLCSHSGPKTKIVPSQRPPLQPQPNESSPCQLCAFYPDLVPGPSAPSEPTGSSPNPSTSRPLSSLPAPIQRSGKSLAHQPKFSSVPTDKGKTFRHVEFSQPRKRKQHPPTHPPQK